MSLMKNKKEWQNPTEKLMILWDFTYIKTYVKSSKQLNVYLIFSL